MAQSELVESLVRRQARAWETNDFDLAAEDWLPDGELIAPGGRWKLLELRSEMEDFHASFCDLKVTLTSLFSSCDGTHLAIEWLWEVTRRSDGERSTTRDAIIADLSGGRIKSWREYFDPTSSVESGQNA
ncbi:MAG: nuclear transport factor 2 family protein [Actinobacteria bacterium]|nr:nuclear transport factor 2 family protein [Actinomycetota bacterium]